MNALKPHAPRRGLALALSLITATSACSSDDSSESPYADVVFEAKTNDDALEAMLTAPLLDDPAQAAYLLAPTEGATLSATAPLTLRWRVGPPSAQRDASSPPQGSRLASTQAVEAHASAVHAGALSRFVATFRSLAGELTLVGTAYAHGVPIDGRGYFLVIEDAARVPVYRVFSLGFEATVAATKRAELAAAPQPLRASVRTAVFASDAVAEGGGPWQGPTVAFTLTP
jgi:hypothetical protein